MINATGVIVRVRETGAEFGMHAECADRLMSALTEAGHHPLSDSFPAVIIGPIVEGQGDWDCAHNDCEANA